MRYLLFILLSGLGSAISADDVQRVGEPKDCYLYSWGKGPNWAAKVSIEFKLSLFNLRMPVVDDQYFEPTEKALSWVDKQKDPTITFVASVNGRRVVQAVYPDEGDFGKKIGTILLAIETSQKSDWFAPFFAAQPELYEGQFVSGKDVKFGYVATLKWSGTGAMRSHYLFDLLPSHPKIVATLDAGRVNMNDYKTEAEYKEALKLFGREEELLSGLIPVSKGRAGKQD